LPDGGLRVIPYKDDNPTSTTPFVTVSLIAANVLVFLFQSLGSGQDVFLRYGAVPAALLGGEVSMQAVPAGLTVLTSMFMHGGLLHLGGNMLYLWIFGDNIEDELGHWRFVAFYLLGGTVAAYSHALASGGSMVPMVGASGAVSAVLGAYLLLFPGARVRTLVFFGFYVDVVRLPALIVIGFWAIIQMVNGLASSGSVALGGVAWFAHIGGFLYGLVAIYLFTGKKVDRRLT
jgi:membrane associated rhomboid family serine protease